MAAKLAAWSKDLSLLMGERFPKAMRLAAAGVNTASLAVGWISSLIPGTSHRNHLKHRSINFRELALISSKFSLYLRSQAQVQDRHGFVMTGECDSLLFTCLIAAATRDPINVKAARNERGQWFRRPLDLPPCYPEHTKSTISRDMFMGLFWYLWRLKDLKTAEELFDYGIKHNWIMGSGDAARIYMTPALQATLAEIIYRLGGVDHKVYRAMPQLWSKGLEDFQLHLALLHIELRGQLLGSISNKMLDVISDATRREPRNVLVRVLYSKYVTGDCGEVAWLLLNEAWWPSSRLPRSSDRRTDWLNQRAYLRDSKLNRDWLPSNERPVKIHTGGDFLFVAAILLEWN